MKGLSSNDLEAPRNAFVDLKGKIVATFEQKALDSENVLIVLESTFVERVKNHLSKTLALCDTSLEKEPWRVYFNLDQDFASKEDEWKIPFRSWEWILTMRKQPTQISEKDFTLFRLKNNLPVQGVDYDEEFLLNIADDGEFVSYTKGCYLGQEMIARIHHRSRPPKRLVVKAEEDCSADERTQMTSKTVDPDTGKTMGFIFISNDSSHRQNMVG